MPTIEHLKVIQAFERYRALTGDSDAEIIMDNFWRPIPSFLPKKLTQGLWNYRMNSRQKNAPLRYPGARGPREAFRELTQYCKGFEDALPADETTNALARVEAALEAFRKKCQEIGEPIP
jgi:hypothetical protein